MDDTPDEVYDCNWAHSCDPEFYEQASAYAIQVPESGRSDFHPLPAVRLRRPDGRMRLTEIGWKAVGQL
ncbi:hypothetical protein CVN68_02295 [Sphingomonas psychrotolerans]|uniref:Uncharacterized protein n=1 Tax=Sphingomonas psychrotolerans TaxID=1327635 RepID=A0A2K8MIF6_9SPHN|nr:hypothetical protein CVN68_02295 [Sphingomonas psychrotolerans]